MGSEPGNHVALALKEAFEKYNLDREYYREMRKYTRPNTAYADKMKA